MNGLNAVLQSLANMLNVTTNELQSILNLSKDNLPEIYKQLAWESVLSDIFTNMGIVLIIVTILFGIIFWVAMIDRRLDVKRHKKWLLIIGLILLILWVIVIVSPVLYPNINFIKDLIKK